MEFLNNKTQKKYLKIIVNLSEIECYSCISVIEKKFFQYKNDIKIEFDIINNNIIFIFLSFRFNEKFILNKLDELGYEINSFKVLDDKRKKQHLHKTSSHDKHFSKFHFFQKRKKERFLFSFFLFSLLFFLFFYESFKQNFFHYWFFYIIEFLFFFFLFFIGDNFFLKSINEVKKRKKIGVNTLISLSIFLTIIFSFWNFFCDKKDNIYFLTSIDTILFLNLGNQITRWIRKKINFDQNLFFKINYDKKIIKIENNQEKSIFLNQVSKDDVLLVRKGEIIPTDGILLSKKAYLDESMITGENIFVEKYFSDQVIGRTLNKGNLIKIKVTKIGKETLVDSILLANEKIRKIKPKLENFSDKIATFFVPIILFFSLFIFLLYFILLFPHNFNLAFQVSMKTLIIACPCAIGIVVPLITVVGINKALKNGIIYNQTDVFDKINKIGAVCFDKTGTITKGHKINKILGDKEYIPLAVSMQFYSLHPYANAFAKLNFNQKDNFKNFSLKNFQEILGFGLKALYNDKELIFTDFKNTKNIENIKINQSFKNYQNYKNEKILCFIINNEVKLLFFIIEYIRKDVEHVIKKFKKKKINLYIISGDNFYNCQYVSKKLNISNFYFDVKPEEKAFIVANIQKKLNKKVAYVGDGINDSLALLQSDLGISFNQDQEISAKNSSITLLNNDIFNVWKAISITKIVNHFIIFNLIWLFLYNLIMILIVSLNMIPFQLTTFFMILSEIILMLIVFFFWLYNPKNIKRN
jgi:P-type Cu+ transporter